MVKTRRSDDREELLADVAEMYYEEDLTQADISREIGLTRSAVSRMLTEARDKGIVDIRIRRPLRFDAELQAALVEHFGLRSAHVLLWQKDGDHPRLRERLGQAGAQVLQGLLVPNMEIGVAWGTTINATIDALEVHESVSLRIVQLVGVLGSRSHAFNAQALVERMARKLGGEGIYLYTPFIVESADTARSLLNNLHIRDTLEIGKNCDIALLGIGTTEPQHCRLYLGGHISQRDLDDLREAGAVGDVSAYHFDLQGRSVDLEFHNRLVGISREDLLAIPMRLGVAGGTAKAEAILGALRGGYVNILVTDSTTAAQVLELDRALWASRQMA